MNEIAKQFYDETNDAFGFPQTYKEVKFYPVLVKDLEYIKLFHTIFTYPKIAASYTKRLFKMSYLKFILQEIFVPVEMIEKYFKYATKQENVKIEVWKQGEEEIVSLDDAILVLNINETKFSEEEFEILREIILEQNGMDIDYINQYKPDLEESLEWNQKEYPLTFNDQIFTCASLYKKTPTEIGEWTAYQLSDLFDRAIIGKQYDIYEPLLVSGQITMKSGKLQSYLYHKQKKDRYESILMPLEEFDKLEASLKDKNSI
jgi:hypothetical protein